MLKYNKNNKINARKMRKEMTPWERKLWFDFLQTIGFKFYRQKMVDNYILDFYCAKKKIGIELDGSQHYDKEQIEKDEKRTEVLQNLGIEILRYTNLDIDRNFGFVCQDIYNHLVR